MIYLDTGCLLKLYYPEPESARVASLVSGHPIAFILLHELELLNALELKIFRKEATVAQVQRTTALVQGDASSGILHRPVLVWEDVLTEAMSLAQRHTRILGFRSLDILHCAAAQCLAPTAFVTTDTRQRRLAMKMGLACPSV